MYCDKCNVDFPEGLRYCKWCGESLADRPRVTSELHTCPSCSAAVQPGWAYCKACGERLHAAPREPVGAVCPHCGAVTNPGALNCLRCGEDLTGGSAGRVEQESAGTMIIAMCPSCGERLDTGSLYCKACGSAVYAQETPFGGSALLCGLCNSYSPLGSRACRVCGASFAQAQQTVVDRPIFRPDAQEKPNTLKDLDEHLPEGQVLTNNGAPPVKQPEVESGAHTLAFNGVERDEQSSTSRTRGTIETNFLPGTAGSRSEQQAPTSIMQMGRTTGPVEEDVSHPSPASGELTPGGVIGDQDADQTPGPRPTSFGLDAEPRDAQVASETGTEVFTSRPQDTSTTSRDQVSSDEVRTKEFVRPQAPRDLQPTVEVPAVGTTGTSEYLRSKTQIGPGSGGTGAGTLEPSATRELGAGESGASGFAQTGSQPLPQKRTGMMIASLVVAAIVIGAAVYFAWWFLSGRARPAQRVQPVAEQPALPPVVPEKPPVPSVPEGMVAVAAGTYNIGREDGELNSRPQHRADVGAFFIDRTEVTNASYKKFVDATGHKPPSNWKGTDYPAGRGDGPVTGVTWQDAADYAQWAGKRLPTEAEWEAAARGAEGRIYPWGNDWRAGIANIGLKPDKPTADQYPSGIRAVGAYPQGASPAGAVDMIGNAWEWVADEMSPYPGNTESDLELEPGVTYRVIRGGAYEGSKVHDATYRGYLDASQPWPKVGFRCAKDAK